MALVVQEAAEENFFVIARIKLVLGLRSCYNNWGCRRLAQLQYALQLLWI